MIMPALHFFLIDLLLTFLTFLIMMPFQLIYEFSDGIWNTVAILTGSIYFISSIYYMFATKNR